MLVYTATDRHNKNADFLWNSYEVSMSTLARCQAYLNMVQERSKVTGYSHIKHWERNSGERAENIEKWINQAFILPVMVTEHLKFLE